MIKKKSFSIKGETISVNKQQLLDCIADLHNLFLDLDVSAWDRLVNKKGIDDILLQRQAVIKGRLVESLEDHLGEKLRLPRISPFRLDVEDLKKIVN